MLKKLFCAAALLAAMTTVAGAETIAEYDFGKEVLRVQGESGFVCEYEDFADKISSSSTWDGGAALRVHSDYDLLSADDTDGKLTYTYTIDVPYTGKYRIFLQEAGVDAYNHSQSTWEIDGTAVTKKKTNNNKVDVTRINYIVADLDKGEHTMAVNIPKAPNGNNEGKTCGRFYYTLDYISFHYYYDVDNNFTSLGMYDAASNSVYGPAYGEFARFNGGKTEDCYAEFEITAPKAGYYVVDLEAQQQDNSGISRFETYVNGEKAYGTTELPKLVYGTPAHATSPENERRYLRDYQFVVYLNENTNKLKLVALNERSNQWLLIDKLTVSTLPAPEASKVRLEGEHAYNTAEAYTLLTHGSAKLVGYTDFSNGITLQTYGTRSDESTDELELKYTVEAPAAGAYNMGLLCNSSGSNFDMGINNVRYSSVRANSTRTTNAIASSSSTAASDMYLYSYNNRVYLTEGTNEITVYVKPRTDDGAYIVDIDYFDFNLKEAGADDPVLTISNVTYNGVDAAPTAGTNDVELNLSNITPFDTGDIYVIAAVYDAGVLKNAYVETASVGAGESDIPVTFSGLTYESGNTINIFAWGKTNIAPLAKEIYTYTETASEEQE